MFLNELSPDDLPTNPIIWTPEDLTKALDGDPTLRQKLERDINTKLDGTPLDGFSINSVIESIVLAVPVPVEVTIKGEKRTLTATVLEQFQTRFAAQVAKRFTERFRTNEQLIGLYREEANRVATGDAVREDVALSLRERISPNRINQLAEKPRRVLETPASSSRTRTSPKPPTANTKAPTKPNSPMSSSNSIGPVTFNSGNTPGKNQGFNSSLSRMAWHLLLPESQPSWRNPKSPSQA